MSGGGTVYPAGGAIGRGNAPKFGGTGTSTSIQGTSNAGSGALGTASGALSIASGVIDNVTAITGAVQNKKAREQNAAQFREGMDFQKEQFEHNKKLQLKQALQAQKDRQKAKWYEGIANKKQTEEDAKQRAKLYAFINGIRGMY